MTRPYSMDQRQRAVSLVEAGQPRRAVARLLDPGEATVIGWMRRHGGLVSCAAKPMGGSRNAVLLPERDWLLARTAAAPDLTIRGLRAELAERGTKVSYGAVRRLMHRARLRFNKMPARRRAGWKRYPGRIDPNRLVFIDGSRHCLERGQDKTDPNLWLGTPRPTSGRGRAL